MKPELLEKRVRGELPLIEIGSDTFIIDWRFRELRCMDDPSRVIDLSRMDLSRDGSEYLALYDPLNKEVLYNPPERAFHKDMQVLSIPYELKLDPVGVAREFGLSDTELLDKFPIQEKLRAKLEPIEKFQKRNLKPEQKPPQQQISRRQKRKGKRLLAG